MAHANDMVNIAQAEFEQLVGKNTGSVRKSKQRVVGKDGAQAHGPGVEDGFMTQVAETGMAVDDVDALAQHNIAEHGKEGKHGWEGSGAVYDQIGYVVDLETVREVAHAGAAFIGMGDDDDLVAPVHEFCR